MRQDESGRWISDNGRYLWSGTDWIDLHVPGRQATATHEGDEPVEARGTAEPELVAPDPDPGPGADPDTHPGTGTAGPRGSRSRRPLVFLTVLVLLLAAGVGAVLVAGNSSKGEPAAAPAPAASTMAPGEQPPAPSAPDVLDETQRRDRAQAALLRRADLPGTTEERATTPTDLFLPCRKPALVPPAGSVQVGLAVSTADFTTYVGQTIVGFPTARQAADALGQIRSAISDCGIYEYRYANSERVDRITHTEIEPNFALGDGGVYLVEVDTPANYAGAGTSYSYGYVQRGQFLVRLTLTNRTKPDRGGVELLTRKMLDRLE